MLDTWSWKLIQVISYLQGVVCGFLAQRSTGGNSMKMWLWSVSGYALAAMPLEDVPDIVRSKLLRQGRALLIIILFVAVLKLTRVAIGSVSA